MTGSVTLAQEQDEAKIQRSIDELIRIEDCIRRDIIGAQQEGKLLGYAFKDGVPDFDFYIRPVSSVEKTFTDGNPYLPVMIESRGYPVLAEQIKLREIPEFRMRNNGTFKRDVLATST